MKNKKKFLNYLGIIIYLAIYAFLAISVGLKHEHWADEAQSWLIARDNSFIDILKIIRYEGTPPLWHYILKFFILCGLKYNQLIYLTTSITIIGIILLFRNKNIPLLIKLLLPYTFFIFFQYTIVARSYVLLFPILMAIANIYPNKEKHLGLYGFLLFLLMNISSHSFLLSGALWFIYLIELIVSYKNEKRKIQRKEILFLIVLAIAFIGVVILVFPAKDCMYHPSVALESDYILGEVILTNSGKAIFYVIGTIVFFSIFSFACLKKENAFKSLCLMVPNLIWIAGISGAGPWHYGILFILLIFVLTINNCIKNYKIVNVILTICLVVQIVYTVQCSINDIKYNYSVGEQVKDYLEEIGYQDKKIAGVDFWSIQVNPYFEKNIFSNFKDSYTNWKTENYKKIISKYVYKHKDEYDIFIMPYHNVLMKSENQKRLEEKAYEKFEKYYNDLSDKQKEKYTNYWAVLAQELSDSDEYDYKYFEGNMYYKGKVFETTGVFVFVKNEEVIE